MAPRILVVDRNQAFATMLQDMLVSEGGYHAEVAGTGHEALNRLRQADFDLTIIDVDLAPDDMTYQQLIRQVRRLQPTMRLMLIPLMGEDLPADVRQLDIQGTLSKPFFADDLLAGIQEALAKKVQPAGQQPAPPSGGEPAADTQGVLAELVRETQADAALLVSTAAGAAQLVAHVSAWDVSRAQTLARLSATIVRTARAAAGFFGGEEELFGHYMFESRSLRLYMMALPENLLLVTVTPLHTPLGTVRANLRRAARSLTGLPLT